MKTETKYTILRTAVASFLLVGSTLTNRADQILLSAPSANRSYYGMYSPYVTAASFTLASSYDVSTIDVVLRTPASTSFTTFHFSLQDALTGPVTIFASQDLAVPLGVASTEVMYVNQTLPAGTYYLAGIVPGYAGTPVTPGNVDGWLLSSGVYTQAAGTIANGVWSGNPPAFLTGGVYVAPAFTVNGSVVPEPTLPGLYFTNAILLPDGRAQFELRTPSASSAFALQYSRDLGEWVYWTSVSGTNRYVMQSPEPIAAIGNVFLRAAPLGQLMSRFSFEFRVSRNAPLVNGTPSIGWPQQLDNWQAILQVDNCTNFPPAANVLISGPAGSGIVNLSTDFWPDDAYSGSYEAAMLPLPPAPPGGVWTVTYGPTNLTFNEPDPQTGSRFLLIVPNCVISNGYLVSMSWTYRNPGTGTVLAALPDYVTDAYVSLYGPDFTRCGENDYTIFEKSIGRTETNHVFSPPIVWSNAMFQFEYEDTLKNSYTMNYSFGNLYEVWGGNSFSGLPYCDPAASGFTLLGSATNTATFAGGYNVYLIRAPKHNVLKVDTVRGSDGLYYPTHITGNTSDYQNIGGAPDGLYATVGPTPRGFFTGGFFVTDATGRGLSSVTVYVSP